MRSPSTILDEVRAVQATLLEFLGSFRGEAPAPSSGGEPILCPELEDPDLLPRLAAHLPDQEAAEAFTARHEQAEEAIHLPLWLALIGTEAALHSGMEALALEYLGKKFPLTGQPLEPLPIGERAIASLILAYDLLWLESRVNASSWARRLAEWAGGAAHSTEDEVLLLASRLLEFLRWDAPPDPTGELAFLDVLLQPMLPRYLERWSRKRVLGASNAEGHWLHIWCDILERSPITLLLSLDAITSDSPTGASAEHHRRARVAGSAGTGERIDPRASLRRADWSGLEALAARRDLDLCGPLLQPFGHALHRLEESGREDRELSAVVRRILRQLEVPLDHSGLPAYPKAQDLHRFLLMGRADA